MNSKLSKAVWIKKYKSKISLRRIFILLSVGIVGVFLGSVLLGKSWIAVLTALLTPMIAIAGIGIGITQTWINKKRLQHELFEKRIKLYEVITTHIANGVCAGTFSYEEATVFLRDTKHARFIFGKDIADFVNEIYKKSTYLTLLNRREEKLEGAQLERTIEQQRRVFEWFQEELNNIQNRFDKYLQL